MYNKAKKYLLQYTKQKDVSTKKNWSDEDVISIMYQFLNDESFKSIGNNINHWIDIKDGQPTSGQKCWVLIKGKDVYLSSYGKYGIFDRKPTFINMIGRGWKISNVEKWSPLIIPSI